MIPFKALSVAQEQEAQAEALALISRRETQQPVGNPCIFIR